MMHGHGRVSHRAAVLVSRDQHLCISGRNLAYQPSAPTCLQRALMFQGALQLHLFPPAGCVRP